MPRPVSIRDNLKALEIALTLEPRIEDAKMLALSLIDWATLESDGCAPEQLDDAAWRCLDRRR